MRTSKINAAAAAASTETVAVKPTKRGKPAATPAIAPIAAETIIEATPDPRVVRAERIKADRAATNALYATFEANRVSVPVKALSAFKPAATTAHPIARNPSARQAAALAAALSATGGKLIDGASAARVFELNGVRSCIENGVLRDAVSSGLCTVSGDTPETEIITIKSANAILGLIGATAAKAGNLLAA